MKYESKSKLQSSQIPPTEITLADLHLAVLNLPGLGKIRHRDLLSTVVRIGRIAGRELNQIPLNLRRLKEILEQGSPGTESLSHKSLQNIRSDLAAAIAISGLTKFLRTAKVALLPEWKAVFDHVEDCGVRIALSRFARFCSALEISPTGVEDAIFECFLVELEAGSLVRNPAHIHRQAVWAWNKACRTVPIFPGRPVTPAQVGRAPHGIDWEKLSPSFTADLAAWEQWGAVMDPYDDDARSRALKRSTLLLRRNHVRSAITMAKTQGTEIGDVPIPRRSR